MTDKATSEALRLAAWLNEGAWHKMRLGDVEAAGRELRRQHARIAELEAEIAAVGAGGVQALSAAPAGPWSLGEIDGNWRDIDLPDHGAVMRIVWKMEDDDGRNAKLEAQAHAVVAALNAASPTPPAEQSATTTEATTPKGDATTGAALGVAPGAVYAELPEPYSTVAPAARPVWKAEQMRDFADRTHALRQARTTLPEGWTACTIEFGNDGPEEVAYGPQRMMTRLAKWLGKYFAQVIAEAAPKAAPGEPRWWRKRADEIEAQVALTGSPEAMRCYTDMRTLLQAAAEAAPECPTCNDHGAVGNVLTAEPCPDCTAAPQQEAQEPYGWLYDWTHSSATGKPDTTYTGFTEDEAHARKHDNCRAIYTAPQPAPAPLSDDVVKDAARWRMVALIGYEVMLHPEKRTQAAAVKAYMDATHSGSDLTGAVDAALAAQGGKDAG